MPDTRRTYYDHEPAWQTIRAKGGRGWDDLWDTPAPGSYDAVREFLTSQLALALRGGLALDLGCGGGQVALLLAEAGYTTLAVDFSPTAVELARQNAATAGLRVEVRVDDVLTLTTIPTGAMDLVVDNHVWHCLVGETDRLRFLEAVSRVLRPGGLFFSETMSREGAFDPAAVDADPTSFVSRGQNRFWASRAELNDALRVAGLEILFQDRRTQVDAPWAGDTVVVIARR